MAYKGFSLITALTPKPWGTVEEQNWKDMADTVLMDCPSGARVKNTTYGHRHYRLYNDGDVGGAGGAIVTVDSVGVQCADDVIIAANKDLYLGYAATPAGTMFPFDTENDITHLIPIKDKNNNTLYVLVTTQVPT